MKVYRQIPIYRFLDFCIRESEKEEWKGPGDSRGKILDCGAGGNMPPLILFAEAGFETAGLEIDPVRIESARRASETKGLSLNIRTGDMRKIPFPEGSFHAVYSYNSIFHMTRSDMEKALGEMNRVLKTGGLLFVNFLSVKDQGYGTGREIAPGEFLQDEGGSDTIHTYLREEEADALIPENPGVKLVFKEVREVTREYEGEMILQVYMDYTLQKF